MIKQHSVHMSSTGIQPSSIYMENTVKSFVKIYIWVDGILKEPATMHFDLHVAKLL